MPKKLAPIGSNMNDAAYPFRGEHRLAAEMNHGHSTVAKAKPTTLAVRITGSNLMIEQLDVPKGQDLRCELGIDGGVPRPVSLASAQRVGLAVPGDGRDYNVTATVVGDGKHYCRMTFNGTEGARYLRVRAPPISHSQQAAQLHFTADGQEIFPSDGWYAVPIHAEECSISVTESRSSSMAGRHRPDGSVAGSAAAAATMMSPSVRRISGSSGGSTAAPQWQSNETAPLALPPPPPTPIMVEMVHDLPVDAPTPMLQSVKTGQSIALSEHASVAVPSQEGPYRLRLPSVSSVQSVPPPPPSSLVSPSPSLPVAVVPTPVGAAVPAADPVVIPPAAVLPPVLNSVSALAAPPAPAVPERIPEIETSLSTVNPAAPCFVVKAAGFQVHLTSETGSTATGKDEAKLTLPHKGMQWVRLAILNEQGQEVLKQRQQIASMEAKPVEIQVTENQDGGLAVTARKGSTVLLSGTPVVSSTPDSPGVIRLAEGSPSQNISVEQVNGDGSVSSVMLNVIPRPTPPPPPREATPPPPPPPPAPAMVLPDFAGWLSKMASGLKESLPGEAAKLLQAIAPPTADAAAVQQFAYNALNALLPEFSFVAMSNSLEGVQCTGYNITATVGNQPPYFLSTGGSIPVTPGNSVQLSAVHPSSGKPAGSCRVHLSVLPQNEDEVLLARILDSLQRHNLNPASVAEDLANTNNGSLSPLGHRTLPLLIQCLRKALDAAVREDVLCTARNGYLENIYTREQSLLLTASVNNGSPTSLSQHSRLPVTGTFPVNEPTFVKITAKDITGVVKGETVLTVVGPAPERPPPLPASASSSARSTVLQPPPPLNVVAVAGSGSSAPDTPQNKSRNTPLQPPPLPSSFSAEAPAPTSAPAVPPAHVSALQHHCPASAMPRPMDPLPYLDVSMQQVAQDMQIRALAPAGLLIACNVNGVGGNTGKNDFITKVHAHQPHTFEFSLIDSCGQVVFQQKLEVPAVSSLMWGLCLQDNGMSVDPDGLSTTTTISLDRAPERTLQSNFMPFDTSKPHYLSLRRYLNGLHGLCSGELAIRLPGFISPKELQQLIHLIQMANEKRLDNFNFEREMLMLSSQCSSPVLRDLIAVVLQACKNEPANHKEDHTGPRVFFRLTGAE